jgi:hypothetical protein
LEDAEDYKAFEISITSAFDAQTSVERELVLRLASVMWRLRRSTTIETGLLKISKQAPVPGHGVGDRVSSLMDVVLSDRVRPADNHGDGALRAPGEKWG